MTEGQLGFEGWPWELLTDPLYLNSLIDSENEAEAEAEEFQTEHRPAPPLAVHSLLGALKESQLAKRWSLLLVDYESTLNILTLNETVTHLIERGFRPEYVKAFIFALISCQLTNYSGYSLDRKLPISQISLLAAKAIMGGLNGNSEHQVVEWVLEFSSECGSTEAADVLESVGAALSGEPSARRDVVLQVLPYWKMYLSGALDSWSPGLEDLGFPYQFALELEFDIEVATPLADFLYRMGRSGDEDRAALILASAAIRGAHDAWALLRVWCSYGDKVRVERSLMSAVMLKLYE